MHADEVIARIAGRQHGVVGFAQLVGSGVSRRAIERRVASGHLIRVHRGVYLVGHRALPPLAREAAALLAVGRHAVLSHHSAARLWGIADHDGPVHVSVTKGQPRRRPGIEVHRPANLRPDHIRTRNRIPLTSPQRTLSDLRGHVSAAQHERATSEAMVERLIAWESHGGITRSEAERKLLRLIEQAGLPRPRTNARVAGYEVDFLWRDHRIVAEVDGYAFHGHRLAFERDRAKQQALAAANLRVTRITFRQLERPYAVVAALAQALGASAPGAPSTAASPRCRGASASP